MTPEQRKELRTLNPHDSYRLFMAACKKIRQFEADADIDDYPAFYRSVVSNMVNDPTSRFYLHG